MAISPAIGPITPWRRVSRYLTRQVGKGLTRRLRSRYLEKIRPRLPTIGWIRLNGVSIPLPRKLLDPLLPASWVPYRDHPQYETALVAILRRELRGNQRVVIIGGGFGVTTVIAAQIVGSGGNVVCYEAVRERLFDTMMSLKLNDVSAPVQLKHAVVGPAISLFGGGGGATVVAPGSIPECDVLEMDCEGAEIRILSELEIRPALIVVETHGNLGAPTSAVRTLLEKMSYVVEDEGVADLAVEALCIANDVRVLIGRYGGTDSDPDGPAWSQPS